MQQEGIVEMSNTDSWSQLATLARQGVDNFVALQKNLLDIAVRENTTLMEKAQDSLNRAATPAMADLAGRSTQAFLQSQKMMLDVALQQNQLALGLVRGGGPAFEKLADILSETAVTFVEAQKRLLEFTGQQAEAILKGARESGATIPNPLSQMADVWRYSVQAFVDVHKKVLDQIAQGAAFLTARWALPPDARPSGEPAPDFVDLARKSFENYTSLQRQLTEQAARLMEDWTRAWQTGSAWQPPVTFEDIARRGVDAFVNTQRDILQFAFRSSEGKRS